MKVKVKDIILKKWHNDNNEFSYITLKELWINGFHNGQSTMAENINKDRLLKKSKHHNKNTYYATEKYFDEVWKAFWYELEDAEVIVDE